MTPMFIFWLLNTSQNKIHQIRVRGAEFSCPRVRANATDIRAPLWYVTLFKHLKKGISTKIQPFFLREAPGKLCLFKHCKKDLS